MGSTFQNAIEDLCYDIGIGKTPPGQHAALGADIYAYTNDTLSGQKPLARLTGKLSGMIVPALSKDGFDLGVLAIVERDDVPGRYRIAGSFAGSTLCVDEEMRGAGLGEALVVLRLLRDEQLPTWDHDEPGYSPDGAAVIKRGLASLQSIATSLIEGKDLPEIAEKLGLNVDIQEDHEPCP
jgi:hypothetical protein